MSSIGRKSSLENPRPAEPAVSVDPPTIITGPLGSSHSGFRGNGQGVQALPVPGCRIGPYLLQDSIATGGMGAVYRAIDQRLEREVALKILPPEHASCVDTLQRFYQEARATARLDHENIARVYAIGHDSGYHYIAFEYIAGMTIRNLVDTRGPLTIVESINYTLQIGIALVHASERGVVHRDIKPSNIIVTPQGRVKLVDMGLARDFERRRDEGLTQSGMTLGTFDYISPEQARDPRDTDVRSDLYSLGCTLFHMLTGRPPFPDGTVLQKLLQHQEEAPRDVRTFNPQIPGELAAILAKLMEKTRERRYQTPEQLVRDLLTVAGSLGMRSVSPEGLIWLKPDERPWEKHLVWALPAFAFGLIVLLLAYWSRDVAQPLTPGLADVTADSSSLPPTAKAESATSLPVPESPATSSTLLDPGRSQRGYLADGRSADLRIASSEDLRQALLKAGRRATVWLLDEGPYELRVSDALGPLRLNVGELTLKPVSGRSEIRVVVEPSRLTSTGPSSASALECRSGRLEIEDLDFVLEAEQFAGDFAMIRSIDNELVSRRCSFLSLNNNSSAERASALELVTTDDPLTATAFTRSPTSRVQDAFFDRQLVAIRGRGSINISLRDCTFRATRPVLWLENNAFMEDPASIWAENLTVCGESEALFRFDGVAPRVRLKASLIAPPPGRRISSLVAASNPARLDWLGEGNAYGEIATYLQPVSQLEIGRPDRSLELKIITFAVWAGEAGTPRQELGSRGNLREVWRRPDPIASFQTGDLALAFQASRSLDSATDQRLILGARIGPFGPITSQDRDPVSETAMSSERTKASSVPPEGLATATGATRTPMPSTVGGSAAAGSTAPQPRTGGDSPTAPSSSSPNPPPATLAQPPAVEPLSAPVVNVGEEGSPPISPMIRAEPNMPMFAEEKTELAEPRPTEIGTIDSAPAASTPLVKNPDVPATTATLPPSTNPTDLNAVKSDLVRTTDQFLERLKSIGTKGGTIRVASGIRLELPPVELSGRGTWRILGESADKRPVLQLTAGSNRSTNAFFAMQAGFLEFENLDFVSRPLGRAGSNPALVEVGPAGEVHFKGCVATSRSADEPRESPSRLIVVSGARALFQDDRGLSSGTRILISNCFFRTNGDLLEVEPPAGVDLEITNAVLSLGGSLLRAHGQPRGEDSPTLKIRMRQLSLLTLGGLAHLESRPDEPKLPVADMIARKSLFISLPGSTPLLRVDGQDEIETLKDRIRWEAHSVAYHGVTTYRRDQTTRTGILPKLYDQTSWTIANGSREEALFHGDVLFQTTLNPERNPCDLLASELALDPESPATSAGADLTEIPTPVSPIPDDLEINLPNR